jgi:soluble lytic murein transglycosylase-like protein
VPRHRSPAIAIVAVALIGSLLPRLEAPADGPLPPAALEELLAASRRSLRGESPLGASADSPVFETLETAGGLFRLRLTLARAAAALAAQDAAAAARLACDVDSTPLGLPGLAEWARLSARLLDPKTRAGEAVPALLAYAEREGYEPLAREARGAAARAARMLTEKRVVREAWGAQPAPDAAAPRATIARALALARVAESAAAGHQVLAMLARQIPDAPERAPDLFDEIDLTAYTVAVKTADIDVRLARARVLAPRAPKDAVALLKPPPSSPGDRLAAAEVHLLSGAPREALGLLQKPRPLAFADAASGLRVAALELSAELRLVGSGPSPRVPKRRKTRAARVPHRAPMSDAARSEGAGLLLALDRLLFLDLADADRTRLLGDGVRAAVKLERHADARRYIEALVRLEPATAAGADELFHEAFSAYQTGRFTDSAALWAEIKRLYRDVAVRRRATYWEARARERAGDADAGALYASLLPGTSPDVYAQWAAAALGQALPEPLRSATGGALEGSLSAAEAGPPSRELQACGLPDLAEDAAEVEKDRDPLFLAAVTSELGEHRRAIAFLKRRYPQLGTPEEASVPLVARRAFYPLGHAELVTRTAARRGLPPALLFALIRQESVFQTSVKSHAGALGLMQVMPATGRFLSRREKKRGRPDLLDPEENVRLGAAYLADLLAASGGNRAAALAAYNAGPGRLRQWKKEFGMLPPDEFLESIPLAESRLYVKRVLFFEGAYAALYGIPTEGTPAPGPLAIQPAPAR